MFITRAVCIKNLSSFRSGSFGTGVSIAPERDWTEIGSAGSKYLPPDGAGIALPSSNLKRVGFKNTCLTLSQARN